MKIHTRRVWSYFSVRHTNCRNYRLKWRSIWNICSNLKTSMKTWRTKRKQGQRRWNKEEELRYLKLMLLRGAQYCTLSWNVHLQAYILTKTFNMPVAFFCLFSIWLLSVLSLSRSGDWSVRTNFAMNLKCRYEQPSSVNVTWNPFICRLQEEKARLEEERLTKEREVGSSFMFLPL